MFCVYIYDPTNKSFSFKAAIPWRLREVMYIRCFYRFVIIVIG